MQNAAPRINDGFQCSAEAASFLGGGKAFQNYRKECIGGLAVADQNDHVSYSVDFRSKAVGGRAQFLNMLAVNCSGYFVLPTGFSLCTHP